MGNPELKAVAGRSRDQSSSSGTVEPIERLNSFQLAGAWRTSTTRAARATARRTHQWAAGSGPAPPPAASPTPLRTVPRIPVPRDRVSPTRRRLMHKNPAATKRSRSAASPKPRPMPRRSLLPHVSEPPKAMWTPSVRNTQPAPRNDTTAVSTASALSTGRGGGAGGCRRRESSSAAFDALIWASYRRRRTPPGLHPRIPSRTAAMNHARPIGQPHDSPNNAAPGVPRIRLATRGWSASNRQNRPGGGMSPRQNIRLRIRSLTWGVPSVLVGALLRVLAPPA